MTKKKLLIALAVVVAIVGFSSAFTVHQSSQALVLQFGEAKRVVKVPGLHFKIPLIQDTIFYDNRIMELDPRPDELILADQKRLVVDTMSRFRIEDPRKFYTSVQTEDNARRQLTNIIISKTREVLGSFQLSDLLSDNSKDTVAISTVRQAVMEQIRDTVDEETAKLGINIIDVRIRRADLPIETTNAILARMIAEREREAKEFRAQGEEQALKIRAAADRERTILIAEAEKDAQILRGQGEGEAYKIYADSFGKDTEFFSFYRSLEAYKKTLKDTDTTFILSPESEFFKFFDSSSKRGK